MDEDAAKLVARDSLSESIDIDRRHNLAKFLIKHILHFLAGRASSPIIQATAKWLMVDEI